MFKLALVTPNSVAAQAIEQVVQEAGGLVFAGAYSPATPVLELLRSLHAHDPELILVDLNDWTIVAPFVNAIPETQLHGRVMGFRESWTREEQLMFAEAGVCHLLREPFGPSDLDAAIHTAMHGGVPNPQRGVFTFLPAKAGGGCSTAALQTAFTLGELDKRVLVVEADVRSGTLSLLLNLRSMLATQEVLQRTGELTALTWQQMQVKRHGIDLMLADPSKPAVRASWTDYYQVLQFARSRYDHVIVDLPEVLNDATAEVARSAESVFVVCTPEVLSLRLATLRCKEAEAYGVPRERIKIVVTRWQRGGISIEDVARSVGWPVFATLANDYFEVHQAVLDCRMVGANSPYAKDCRLLAQKIAGIADAADDKPRFGLLRKLGR